jgi:hypothetical protein
VVPAVTVTGEVTVAPFAGVQIVTEGDDELRVHGAANAEAEARRKIVNSWNFRIVNLQVFGWWGRVA